MGHARALIAVGDAAKQVELYQRIISSQLSVRQVEELTRTSSPKGTRTSARPMKDLSKLLSQHIGSRVQGEAERGRQREDRDQLQERG